MKIILQRHVYSNAPAEAGIWCMRAERDLPGIPRGGDWTELADGWASARVKEVTFMADGRLIAELDKVRTDSPDTLGELHRLVDEHDWKWLGGTPARTGA